MPYLDIRIASPCPQETISKFAACLTDLTVDLLAKKRELTSASVQCIAPGHWHVGGEALSASGGTFFVEVNVTAGTNDAQQKSAFIAAAFAAAEGMLGRLDAASYVIVREVPADAWGYQGLTQAEHAACKNAADTPRGESTFPPDPKDPAGQ